MAILNSVNITATMLARIGTLEQLGLSEREQYEFFDARWVEQQNLIDSGKLENPEVQMELVHEYKECARFVRDSMERNEMLRVQNLNAMQYAQEFKPRNVGELMAYLEAIKARWDGEDTEFLGEFNSLPLCSKDAIGIHPGYVQLVAEHGLITIDPTLG